MALTRITKGVIKPNENYDTHNINSTGIVTAIGLDVNGNGDISGNLSVGGVLTYEDVTSIDSVGIVTVRAGIFIPDNQKAEFGNVAGTADFEIAHDTNNTVLQNRTGGLYFKGIGGSGNTIYLQPKNNESSATFYPDGAVELYHDNSKKFETTSTGIKVAGDIRVGNGSGLSIKNDNASETLATFNNNGSVQLFYDNSQKLGTAGWGVQINGILKVLDSTDSSGATNNLTIGTGSDLKLYHDGNQSYLKDYSNQLNIIAENAIKFTTLSGSETYAKFIHNGAVELYHNNIKRLETSSVGVSIPQDLDVDGHTNLDNVSIAGVTTVSDNIEVVDSKHVYWGTDKDLSITHNGTHGFIHAITGGLYMKVSNGEFLSRNGSQVIAKFLEGTGGVELYHNNNLRVQTDTSRTIFRGASGIAVYGDAGQNQNGQISIHPQGSAVYSNLYFYNAAGNANASIIGHEGQTLFFTSGTNGPLRFRVNGTGFHSFQDGNTERVRITAAGYMGLGTNNPQRLLHLQSTGDALARITSADGNAAYLELGDVSDPDGGKIVYDSGSNLTLYTASNERLRITSSGFVGVGTATVGRGPLELSRSDTGDVQIHMTNAKTGGGVGNGFTIFGCNSTHGDAGFVNRHNGGALEFYTNQGGTIAEKLRITSNGKVGINETSPLNYGIHASQSSESVYYRADSGSVDSIYGSATALGYAIAGTTSNHPFVLFANNAERLRIASDGRLTSTRSTTTAYNAAATTNDSSVIILNSGAAGHATLQFQSLSGGSANTGQATISAFNESSGSKNTALTFGTRQNSDATVRERLRIDSSGVVEITTTGGGVTFRIRGGGDQEIYAANNTDKVTMYCDTNNQLTVSEKLKFANTSGGILRSNGNHALKPTGGCIQTKVTYRGSVFTNSSSSYQVVHSHDFTVESGNLIGIHLDCDMNADTGSTSWQMMGLRIGSTMYSEKIIEHGGGQNMNASASALTGAMSGGNHAVQFITRNGGGQCSYNEGNTGTGIVLHTYEYVS